MPTIRTVAVAALAATLAGASAAQADLTVVQSTTIKNPQITAMMQSMSPEQRARMAQYGGPMSLLGGGAVATTLYSHGSKTRVDMGSQSTIVDITTHKLVILNRATHTYTTSTYSPNAMAGQMHATVKDTGQTKTILGHPARHYTLSMTSAQLQGGTITGDLWSAQDLPQPPASAFSSGPAAALQGQFRKVKGMPLIVNMTVKGSPVGDTNIHSVTKSVSRSSLPASLFAIPAGYQLGAARPTMGGFPMGR